MPKSEVRAYIAAHADKHERKEFERLSLTDRSAVIATLALTTRVAPQAQFSGTYHKLAEAVGLKLPHNQIQVLRRHSEMHCMHRTSGGGRSMKVRLFPGAAGAGDLVPDLPLVKYPLDETRINMVRHVFKTQGLAPEVKNWTYDHALLVVALQVARKVGEFNFLFEALARNIEVVFGMNITTANELLRRLAIHSIIQIVRSRTSGGVVRSVRFNSLPPLYQKYYQRISHPE